MMSAGFAATASATDVSGSVGPQWNHIIGKSTAFEGLLLKGNIAVELGEGFSFSHTAYYDPEGDEFFERDYSLKKSFNAGPVALTASLNLYCFGPEWTDLAEKGDAFSPALSGSVPVAGGVSIFGGVEYIAIIDAPGNFSTWYGGVDIEPTKGVHVKPRMQGRSDDSPYFRGDVSTDVQFSEEVSMTVSGKLIHLIGDKEFQLNLGINF
jgi:hypothetical protein